MKYLSSVILVTLFCGVQQFSPILCDNVNASDIASAMANSTETDDGCDLICELLSFLGIGGNDYGSGYENDIEGNNTDYDYYYDGSNPVEEEIIIIPLTSSNSGYDSGLGGLSGYDYANYNESSPSGSGQGNNTSAFGNLFSNNGLLGLFGNSSSSGPSSPSTPVPTTNTSAPSAMSSTTSSPESTSASGNETSSSSSWISGSGSGSGPEYGSGSGSGWESASGSGSSVSTSGAAISTSAPSTSAPTTISSAPATVSSAPATNSSAPATNSSSSVTDESTPATNSSSTPLNGTSSAGITLPSTDWQPEVVAA